MKKIYAIILSVIIAVLSAVSLAGCNDNNKEQNVENKDVLIKKIDSLRIGDTIRLGKTEKDEDIEWKVYNRLDDAAKLVTTQPVAKVKGNTLEQWLSNFAKAFKAKYDFFKFTFGIPIDFEIGDSVNCDYRNLLLSDKQKQIGEPFWASHGASRDDLILITPVFDPKTDYKVDDSSDTLESKQNVMLLMQIEGLKAEN